MHRLLYPVYDTTHIYEKIQLCFKRPMTFEPKYTDEKLLKALVKCLERATIPASEVALELDGSAEYVKKKLLDLEKRGLVESKKVGSSWCFRPANK